MQGSLQPLVQMFSGDDTCLVIPVYQRNYDWDIENCRQLFDDLITVTRKEKPNHFFGSIVYKVEGAIGESTIIDGQQRLTTVNLVFLALHHALTTGLVESDPRLQKRIQDGFLRSEFSASGYKLKLKPVKADASAYEKLFGDPVHHDETSTVTANFNYLVKRIAAEEISPQETFEALRKLQVMRLQLDDVDDAQLIFESLNSTGRGLTEADLIRNFVLMGLPRMEQDRLYEECWNRMEVAVSFETSAFIRHYLTAMLGRTPRQSDLYPEFKDHVGQRGQSIGDVLADMRDFAYHYRDLRKATTGEAAVDRLLRRYTLVDRQVTYPFLMLVMRDYRCGVLTGENLLTILTTVDSYLTRRWVCGYPTNALNKIFALLYRETMKHVSPTASFVDVFSYMVTKRGGTGTFPSDAEFMESLASKDMYHISAQQRDYFWESIENGTSKDVRDIAHRLANGELSIEHVMPQTLTPAWQEELGANAAETHDLWLHRLGNLTVTGYNSEYSNRSFQTKRDTPEGFAQSPYRLNKSIASAQRWDATAMDGRTKELVEVAAGIWTTPSTTFTPPETAADTEPMGEDEDFKGRAIKAWEFGGVVHTVTSWKQALLEIVRHLNDEDPAALRRAAGKTGGGVRFDQPDRGYEYLYTEALPGTLVYCQSSTGSKISIIRTLFHSFGLETDDLLFHLYPQPGEVADDE